MLLASANLYLRGECHFDNTYFTFLKFSFKNELLFLVDKCITDGLRSNLTSSKPRYNRNIILNIDNSKDMSIFIKQTSLSHLQ